MSEMLQYPWLLKAQEAELDYYSTEFYLCSTVPPMGYLSSSRELQAHVEIDHRRCARYLVKLT